MKIAVFGLPLAALLLLEDGHEVVFAVLSPVAAPGGRRLRRRLGPSRVVDASGRDPAAVERRVVAALATHTPDLLVSWYWTRRLPEAWLRSVPAVGAHPSLLPRHRGPNPFFWAIDSGDEVTGVSIHRLTPEYDEGDVLERRSIEVAGRDSWQLARALDRLSLAALRHVVGALAAGEPVAGEPQDATVASWAPEPSGDQLAVDWSWETERTLRRIRALSPVPGLAIEVRNTPLFVTRAAAANSFPTALLPGEAAIWGTPRRLVVRTGDGAIQVERGVMGAAGPLPEGQELSGEEVAAVVASREDVVLD